MPLEALAVTVLSFALLIESPVASAAASIAPALVHFKNSDCLLEGTVDFQDPGWSNRVDFVLKDCEKEFGSGYQCVRQYDVKGNACIVTEGIMHGKNVSDEKHRFI